MKILSILAMSIAMCGNLNAQDSSKEIILADSGDFFLNAVAKEVGKRAFSKHNIKFDTRTYPAERALISANSGEADGDAYRVFDLHKKSAGKYPNLIRVNVPYLTIYFTAFVEDENKDIKVNDWKDLANYKVAVIRGNKTMEARVNEFVPKSNQVSVTFYEQAFQMLLKNRVDVVVGKPVIGSNYMKKHKNLHMIGKFQTQDIYIYLHKNHKSIIPKIEAELQKMQDSGELQEIEKMVRNRF